MPINRKIEITCATIMYLKPAARARSSLDSRISPAVAMDVSSKKTNKLKISRVSMIPHSAITAISNTAIERRPSASRTFFR